MELNELQYEQKGKVGCITLYRPEKRNAISLHMLGELRDLFQKLDLEEEVRVVIVKGEGKGFSSGYDIDDVAPREDMTPRREVARDFEVLGIYEVIRKCNMATIAQLHGFCLNGATDLCHHLDFTITADDCVIGYPTMRCWGASVANLWLYHMGPQWTRYMMMTGDTIDGAMAEKIGFAIKAVPEDRLDKTVKHFAERLANVDKDVLAAHKRAVNAGLELMGCRNMLEFAIENDCITNRQDTVQKIFDRTTGLGIEALIKEVNRGFRPQKAPFEPLED